MVKRTITRRQLMRRGSAALGTAALVGTAGCAGKLSVLGDNNEYTQWIPEPGTIDDADHYSFTIWDHTTLATHEDEFDSDTDFDNMEEEWAPADIDREDVTMQLWFSGITIVKSGFDRDDIVDDFEDEDFEDETELAGYQVLVGPEEQAAVGVGGGTLVGAGLRYGEFEDPVGAVEDVIETKNGNEDRYVQENEDFQELSNKLGSGTIAWGNTMDETDTDDPENGQFRDKVAEGRNLTVNGSRTKGKWVLLFEDSSDVDTGDINDWISASQDNDGTFDDWDDLNVKKNGRAAVIKGAIDTDDL